MQLLRYQHRYLYCIVVLCHFLYALNLFSIYRWRIVENLSEEMKSSHMG